MDHFVGILKKVRQDSKDAKAQTFKAEALVDEASEKRDEALAAKSMTEEEVHSLKAKLKSMETKVAQA